MDKLLQHIASAQSCALAIKKMSLTGQIVVMHDFNFYKQLDFLVKSVSHSLAEAQELKEKMQKCESFDKSTQTEIAEIHQNPIQMEQLHLSQALGQCIDTQTPEWPCSDLQTASSSVVSFSIFESDTLSDASPPRVDYSRRRGDFEQCEFGSPIFSRKNEKSSEKKGCLEGTVFSEKTFETAAAVVSEKTVSGSNSDSSSDSDSERWEVLPQEELSSFSQSSNENSCIRKSPGKVVFKSSPPIGNKIRNQEGSYEMKEIVYREYRPESFHNQRLNLCKKKKQDPFEQEFPNLKEVDIELKRKIQHHHHQGIIDSQVKKSHKLLKKLIKPIEILE